jgi:hypothetical protein
MWERRLTGLAIAVVAMAAAAIPLAQSVINAQQDADDLPRLGETAAEYQTRLSRTQGERAAQREPQTPIPAPPSTATADRPAVEAQTPIPAPPSTATADRPAVEAQTPIPAPPPTATTDRPAVEAQTPIPVPRPTATTDRATVEAQTPIPAPAAASPTPTTGRTAVEAQTPIPAPRPTATTERTVVEAQTPIPAPAAASPTATTGRTAVAPAAEQNVKPSDQGDADEIVVLLKRGQDLMRHGDLVAARLVLRHAAEAKNAEAALTLGSTYDPVILRELRVYGFSADVSMARTWYEKAKELGSPEAARRLDNLGR